MGRFLIVTKDNCDTELVEKIRSTLDCHIHDQGIEYDGIVILGGDGTVLRTVASYRTPPIVYAVNRGRVGFLCPIPHTAVDELVERLRDGKKIEFVELKRLCLSRKHHFLNEAVIRPSSIGLGIFRIFIDDISLVVRGDAVIVATKVGSSAYNASLDGPLLLDEGIVVNVVAPNKCRFKPIVCGIKSRVRVEVDGDFQIILDGILCEEKSFDVCYDGSSVRFGYLSPCDRSKRIGELFLL
ncbi:ATP-NAD kinase [Encephalitozoon hellem]|nr:ATP-NAD kinase [Encephalitozoon hellem]